MAQQPRKHTFFDDEGAEQQQDQHHQPRADVDKGHHGSKKKRFKFDYAPPSAEQTER